jgi:hypothetical protein
MHRATDAGLYLVPPYLSITIVNIDNCSARGRWRVSLLRLLALQKGVPIAGRRHRHTKACAAEPDCRQCCHRSSSDRPPGVGRDCAAALRTRLERTRFGKALDRFDLCVVLGDALGRQMWIVEARSNDDSDTLDCSDSNVVDVVRLRTPIACQPDDRWRNSLNRHGRSSICFGQPGACGRVHPRVPDWRNGVHENPMLSTFYCKNAHQSDYCALGRRIGGLAT